MATCKEIISRSIEMKVEIVKRETIKPCSPTPLNLKHFKLSRFDQISPGIYVPLLLFYSGGRDNDRHTKSTKLRTSLSQTLEHYYPLAGRIKDNAYIECNDQGVDYIETTVHACLNNVLENPDAVTLKKFLPVEMGSPEATAGCLFLVQANFFQNGGLVIGVCISHKFSDTSTLSTFMKCWSEIARTSPEIMPLNFTMASMFPPIDMLALPLPKVELQLNKCMMRRYVIGPSAISILKDRAASETVPRPTSVEVVTSLIWKCAMKASAKPRTVLTQSVNLRRRFEPPLPDNLAGNLVGFFAVEIEGSKSMSLQSSVTSMRKGLDGCCKNYVKQLLGANGISVLFGAAKQFGELLLDDQINHYNCSSWCKFPLYEVDFGWGRPTWVSTIIVEIKNAIVLLNTRDGDGIEVWLTLSEEDMALFERDQELLEFVVCNPSAL